jgi:hypothetical protein
MQRAKDDHATREDGTMMNTEATIRCEHEIEWTMIRACGDPGLTFAPSERGAPTAPPGGERSPGTAPPAAVTEARAGRLVGIRAREVADVGVAAVRTGPHAMPEQLRANRIRIGIDRRGMTLPPARRKARARGGFDARHAVANRALVGSFGGPFGKSPARGVGRARQEIAARETA